MSDNMTSKMIKLKSSDGKEFEVSETVLVEQSQTLCRLIETISTENSIPLRDGTSPILEKVFEYCRKHVEAADASKTETTVKGCIKDDDLAAEEEECASIISGLKLSIKEKAEEEECASIISGLKLSIKEKAEEEECASTISGLKLSIKEKAEEEECSSIISGLKLSIKEKAEEEECSSIISVLKLSIKEKAEEEECSSIISGLKLSIKEKAEEEECASTISGLKLSIKENAEEEECSSIISGLKLSTEEKDNTASKTIKLKSSDGKEFEVSETVVQQSQTICRLIKVASTENSIPLVNVTVTSLILEKVFEYCTKHVEAADASKTETTNKRCINSDEELINWDKQFVDDIDKAAMLFDLIMEANYLNIEGLLDVTCRKMADNVMGKSTEEIRQAFNIKDDDQEECNSIISRLTGFDDKKKKKKSKQKKQKKQK